MADAKKKGALAIMFGAGEPDGDEASAPGDGDGDTGLDQACDEMMAAIKSGDKAGFCEAFKAALDLHKAGGGGEEPDGDEAA